MKIGFIGMGNLATAMVKGIIQKELFAPEEIIASRRSEVELDNIQKEYGIYTTTNNKEVVEKAEILMLAVKPQFMEKVITEIKDEVREDQLVVSLAAGKSLQFIETAFGKKVKLVRCMSNTPAAVLEACTGFCHNNTLTKIELERVTAVLSCFGVAEEVPEKLMDTVVGISGSSPAYVFMFIEAMADAAVLGGMPRKQAYTFCAQAVLGSAKLVLETGKHPAELKDMVCSPGGTTIEAVRVLEESGFRAAIMDAVDACIEKSKIL